MCPLTKSEQLQMNPSVPAPHLRILAVLPSQRRLGHYVGRIDGRHVIEQDQRHNNYDEEKNNRRQDPDRPSIQSGAAARSVPPAACLTRRSLVFRYAHLDTYLAARSFHCQVPMAHTHVPTCASSLDSTNEVASAVLFPKFIA